jgi:hypothetical protein
LFVFTIYANTQVYFVKTQCVPFINNILTNDCNLQRAASKGSRVDNVMNAEEKALERKAKEGMNPDEEASFAGKIQF